MININTTGEDRMNHFTSIFSLVCLCFNFISCSNSSYPVSDHCNGKIFYNENHSNLIHKKFSDLLKWKLFGSKKSWPNQVNDNSQPNFTKTLKKGEGSITFINHSTELIQFKDISILTDPVFSERVSPFSWVGPKRHRQPGVTLERLPKIQMVIISHNHYDHLDINSLISIDKKDHPQFFVPLGNKKYLEKYNITNVVELDWWQDFRFDSGLVMTLVPMQHWSTRWIIDRFKTLWGGYVIQYSGLKVLFAGDTGYNGQFKKIKQKLGCMDLSILPIGAYEPRWFMKEAHLNPEEAVRAHLDLNSHLSIGNHFGTFQLTDEAIEDPVTELRKSLKTAKINPRSFLTPKNGQTIFFKKRN